MRGSAVPLVPRHVARFAARAGIAIGQLRWCHVPGCRVVAFAIDDYQRRRLVQADFGLRCPDHRADLRRAA